MTSALYTSQILTIDVGRSVKRATMPLLQVDVRAYDHGQVQLNLEHGLINSHFYPSAADLRRLGYLLIEAADAAEAALAKRSGSEAA